ncbi:MAG TPA: xylose isomerase, partial [Fibrobacteria bacterium]|nr:xylose isomerase [Fibrobacteria bacterium]
MDTIFSHIPAIRHEGPETRNPLAFRYYQKDQMVLGKRMEDQLRCAVCYWHSFAWNGADVFGAGTFGRPWHQMANPLEAAELKMRNAFDFFEKLGAPFWPFHDADIAPEGKTLKESHANLDRLVGLAESEMARTGVKLLWG